MKILFFGDIIGKLGRQAIKAVIDDYKKELQPDIIIANCENLTHGVGINQASIEEMTDAGIDFFTSGNHIMRRKDGIPLLSTQDTIILRPGNFPPEIPGQGLKILEVGTKKLIVINLIGRVFFREQYDDPFRAFDAYYQELEAQFKDDMPPIFVDFHAEATSEKRAFSLYVDGRATVVVGTHTHVPTADLYITENGTGLCSDAGMVGGQDTVIGVDKDVIIYNMLNQVLSKQHDFPESGPVQVNAVFADIDDKKRITKEFKRVDRVVTI